MAQYVRLDVSLKETKLHVLDEAGNRVWRGRCATDPGAIAAAVHRYAPTAVRIGLETGLRLCEDVYLFRSRRENVIEQRAKQIARMMTLIVHGLQTKSYDEFVESFSNPGSQLTALDRLNQQLRFRMRISLTCWYDAIIEYPPDGTPHFYIGGGGEEWGVLISGDAIADHPMGVDFYVPTGSQPGRDARPMEHALREMPGWSRGSDIELAAFAATRHLL
jgi:hypothetical protein